MRLLARLAFHGVLGLTALGALACGSAAQDTPPTVPTGTAEGVNSAREQSDDAELPQVPTPADLFVQGRFKNPQAAFERLTEWLHIPLSWEEILARNLPALAPVLRMDAPVDVAVTLDPDAFGTPKALFAVSLGLADFEQALTGLRQGGHALERVSRHAQFVQLGDKEQCLVARSNGATKARLICSDQRKSLDILAPYMSRTLSTQADPGQDLFLELKAEPLRKRFGKKAHLLKIGIPVFLREASLGNARFDSALSDAAHATVDELLLLIDELETVRLEVSLDPEREVLETSLRFALDGQRSFIAQSLVAAAADAKAAPQLFWTLANGADSAGYSSASSEPQRLEPILSNVAELISGALEHYGVPQASLQNWVAAYRDLASSKGPVVYASGRLPVATSGQKNLSPAQETAQAIRDSVGYHIIAVDADAGRAATLLEQTIQVFNDPQLRNFVQKQGVEELKHLPKVNKARPPKDAPASTRAYELKLSGQALQALGQNSDKLQGIGAVSVHLLLAQQGERTWVALSSDRDFIGAKLNEAIAGENVAPTARRQGLESFASEPASSAGFMTLSGLLASLTDAAAASGELKLDPAQTRLAMPNRGETPIVFRSLSRRPGPHAVFQLRIPRKALEDAAAGVVSGASQQGKAGF